MDITRTGSQPSSKGPAEWFTGSVRIDPLFEAPGPARVRGASVTFEPGARTAWHTHPLGQTLIVMWAVGWAQHWGGHIEEIRPGDVIWFPPGEKHWHGATPTTAMTHIAIQEALNGKIVDWMVSAGHRAIAVRCDVADEAEVAAMVEQTVSTFGRLDAAFNNAGVQSPAVETADASGEEFDRVNAINLRGVWNCMKYELHQMREQGSGAIVNCSSIGGLIGIAGRATYHASKHGVIGLTKSAALEYASRGIRINAVCPGTIETPMVADMLAKEPDAMKDIMRDQPIGRLGPPRRSPPPFFGFAARAQAS